MNMHPVKGTETYTGIERQTLSAPLTKNLEVTPHEISGNLSRLSGKSPV
jgi:hypothetical protein